MRVKQVSFKLTEEVKWWNRDNWGQNQTYGFPTNFQSNMISGNTASTYLPTFLLYRWINSTIYMLITVSTFKIYIIITELGLA